MQQSSMILFCDECGAANDPLASVCVACQHVLGSLSALPDPSVAPVSVVPRPVREVVAGAASTSRRLPLELLPGTALLGHYQVCREIGRGGFSVVYLAEDVANGRRLVAIKRIHLYRLSPRQIIDATETCNREIKMLRLLSHVEGVPKLYENFTDPENWYLIMEYIPGQTLEEYMQQQPGGYLPESKVVEIGLSLTNILQNLHSLESGRGISSGQYLIFRDLKPANIIITPEGKLYLIDFGIARFFVPGQSRDTTPLGSPGYAPPEQYGHAQTDRRADIYSLGVTLQTLLTGRDPLELTQGETPRNPRPFSHRLQKLLTAMMEMDVTQRPETMQETKKRLILLQPFFSAERKVSFFSFGAGLIIGLLGAGVLPLTTEWNVAWVPGVLFISFVNIRRSVLKRRNQGQKQIFNIFSFVLGIIVAIVIVLIFGSLFFFQR